MHRIGRTARAESKGMAITFVGIEEQYAFGKIEQLIEKAVTKAAVPVELGEAPVYNPSRPKLPKNANHSNRPGGGAGNAGGTGGKKPFYKKKPGGGGKPNNGPRPNSGSAPKQ